METAANDAAPEPPSAISGKLPKVSAHGFIGGELDDTVERAPVDRWVWEAHYVRSLLTVDFGAGALATLVAFGLRFQGAQYANWYLTLSVLLPALWVSVLALTHGYERRLLFVGNEEYRLVLKAGVYLTTCMALLSYVFKADLARGYVLIALILTAQLSLLGRLLLRCRLHQARRDGRRMHRVLVLGHAPAVVETMAELHRRFHHGFQVIGACLPADQIGPGAGELDVPVFGTFGGAASSAVAAGADTVMVLSCPELDGPMLRRLAWELERDDIDLIISSSLVDITADRVTVRPVDGLPMMHVEHPRLSGAPRLVKLLFDVTVAVLLLVLLCPVFLSVALWVKVDTGGPVFFRQVRVGRAGKLFRIYQFRTTKMHARHRAAAVRAPEHGGPFKLREDPPVTRFGRRLRRWSLDKLPQLINVLLGHMSLVGPRPPLHTEVERHPQDMRRRLVVKPGMTGPWQVGGRSAPAWADTIRLDLRYVDNWSLSTDVAILIRTAYAVMRRLAAH